MDTKIAKRFAELDQEERDLKSRLDFVKQEKQELEAQLLEGMEEDGISKLTVNTDGGQRTVYMHRQLCAGHNGDNHALSDALKNAGLDRMVAEQFNTQSLSAWVREFDDDGGKSPDEIINELPWDVQQYIKVSEKYSVRSRKN